MKQLFSLDRSLPDEFFAQHDCRILHTLPASLSVPLSEVNARLREGICEHAAYMQLLLEQGLFDGVIVTTHCDQMRRCAAEQPRMFLLNLPRVERPSAALLRNLELTRLGHFLDALEPQAAPLPEPAREPGSGRIRLALLGSPMLFGIGSLTRFLANYDAFIALDLTENGNLCTLETHPFSRPNEPFYVTLTRTLQAQHIRGVILCRTTWCDQYRVMMAHLREVLPCPVTEWVLIPGADPIAEPRAQTRLGAFLESL